MKAEPSVNLEQSVITNKSAGDWKLFIAKLKKKKENKQKLKYLRETNEEMPIIPLLEYRKQWQKACGQGSPMALQLPKRGSLCVLYTEPLYSQKIKKRRREL